LNVLFKPLSTVIFRASVTFIYACNILCTDFFNEECKEDAEDECIDFFVEVPLSKEFDTDEFERFCT